jgi:hypothetical protein
VLNHFLNKEKCIKMANRANTRQESDLKKILCQAVLRIRTESGFKWVSRSGSRKTKNTPHHKKKNEEYLKFFIAGCSRWWAAGFSCSLAVPYGEEIP